MLRSTTRRWLEFLKYYDFGLSYHPGKANVVADALSWKSLQVSDLMVRELNLLEKFRDMSLACEITYSSIRLGMLRVTSKLLSKIREGQKSNLFLSARLESIVVRRKSGFSVELVEF